MKKHLRLMLVANGIITVLFVVFLSAQPILVDTIHFDDTLFLAHLGWRGINGFSPIIDYTHFYGGVTAQFMTWSFLVFGTDLLSINYAFVMLFGASTAALLILGFGRISLLGLSLLTALSAALIISLAPIELGFIHWPRTAHSFVYNHVGIVLMMGLTLFAVNMLPFKSLEGGTALFAGVTAFVLVMLKTTLGIFVPFVAVALLLQKRWFSVVLFAVGSVLGMILLDPGLVRVREALEVALSSAAAQEVAGPRAVIVRTLENFSHQLVSILLVIALLWQLWLRAGRQILRLAISILSCAVGYTAALISMGGTGSYMMLPMLLVAALLISDAYRYRKVSQHGISDKDQRDTTLILLIPVVICYSMLLPSLFSSAGSFIKSLRFQNASLISNGPAANYVVTGEGIDTTADFKASASYARAAIDAATGPGGRWFTDSLEYIMFADGVNLLYQIPDIQNYGVISSGRMFEFSTATMSQPVLSFPVWPTDNLEYFNNNEPLDSDVDLVMVTTDLPRLGLLGSDLLRKMSEDFTRCQKTEIWTLYKRRTLDQIPCTTSQGQS